MDEIENLPSLLTLRETAKVLRVSPMTIKRMDKRGELKALRINTRGDRRFKKEDIISYLKVDHKK